MDCCSSGVNITEEISQNVCRECGKAGRVVTRQTVVHHVKSEKLSCVNEGEYKFCPSEDCMVVYYSAGRVFKIEDVRELVTAKASGDARPLCYCFGFTEGNVRQEIALNGKSFVPNQVSQFVKEKLCACELRNPAGACCLGEINRTVKSLMPDASATDIEKRQMIF